MQQSNSHSLTIYTSMPLICLSFICCWENFLLNAVAIEYLLAIQQNVQFMFSFTCFLWNSGAHNELLTRPAWGPMVADWLRRKTASSWSIRSSLRRYRVRSLTRRSQIDFSPNVLCLLWRRCCSLWCLFNLCWVRSKSQTQHEPQLKLGLACNFIRSCFSRPLL